MSHGANRVCRYCGETGFVGEGREDLMPVGVRHYAHRKCRRIHLDQMRAIVPIEPLKWVVGRQFLRGRGRPDRWCESLECGHVLDPAPRKPARRRRCGLCDRALGESLERPPD